MKPCRCLLALALTIPAFVAQAIPAGTPATSAGASAPRDATGCPAASAVRRLGAVTGKARHIPDEGDPCAGSHGVARPVGPPASSPAP